MRDSLFETIVGIAVVAVAAFFLMFSLRSTDQGGTGDSYKLYAQFANASVQGLGVGNDVRLMGVKVGVVTDIELDAADFETPPIVRVGFTVEEDVALDDATYASLSSDGLLGGTFLKLNLGSGFDQLLPGDTLSEPGKGHADLVSLLSVFIQNIDNSLSEIADGVEKLGDSFAEANE